MKQIEQPAACALAAPVAWPCEIEEADFERGVVRLKMRCADYKVGAGLHWLHTAPPRAIPPGYKLVPVEPTPAMLVAINWPNDPAGYRAMLAAAPEAPQPAKPAEQEPVEIEMPEYHSHGMGCGLEDRGITDRYEAMEYGWYEAIDRVKEELANFGPLYTAPQPATPPGYKLVPESYLSDVSDMVSWLQAWRRASLGVGKLAADASDAIDAMLAAANKENTND